MVSPSVGGPDLDAGADAPLSAKTLLDATGGLVRGAHARERFGDLWPAFAAAFGSWLEPFAVALHGLEPTRRSRAAALAMSDVARLAGGFAREAMHSLAGAQAGGAGAGPYGAVDGGSAGRDGNTGGGAPRRALHGDATGRDEKADTGSGPYEHYTRLAARVDGSFRKFSSSPEFDQARRRAAAAFLDWLEHDRAAASSISRAFESQAVHSEPRYGNPFTDSTSGTARGAPSPGRRHGGPSPPAAEVIMRDGNAALIRHPAKGTAGATVLVVPGFTTGARVFDFHPQCSFTGALASCGVETCLLDWGRPGEADRRRTVTDQLRRIGRALAAARAAAGGRPPALAGHFHGGLLALLYCIRCPGKAGALITLSTPAGFEPGHDPLGDWLRACGGERLAEVFGNVPGALVAALLASATPMQWCGGGFFALLDGVHHADAAARFERARRFPPAFPGGTFRQLYRAFHRENPFPPGGAVLDGHPYDPSSLALPLLNVSARDDGIVPPAASARLGALVPAARHASRTHPGGHYDLLSGRHAYTGLVPDLAAWLIEHARGS